MILSLPSQYKHLKIKIIIMEDNSIQTDSSKNQLIIFLAVALGLVVIGFMLYKLVNFPSKDKPIPFKTEENVPEKKQPLENVATSEHDETLKELAAELNKSCPTMIDAETQLTSVVGMPNNELQYNYTLINYEKEGFDVQTFETNMRSIISNAIISNPDLKVFRDMRTTLSYQYNDKNGMYILKLSFQPDLYK